MGLMREHYDALVAAGDINHDPAQIVIIERFDNLLNNITQQNLTSKSSLLGRIFGRRKEKADNVLGLYLYGDVGRGKTMLMDLFFSCLPDVRKRRAHFNDFMADVHERINQHRQALSRHETKQNDPIPVVAEKLAAEAKVLCFDEFTVTDIADATILGRLFTALFDLGVVLIATSNVAPDNLYRNGMNRDLFLPFIKILKNHVEVINLDADVDYRLEKTQKEAVYFNPLSQKTNEKMNLAWQSLLANHPEQTETISVKGHKISISRSTPDAARFDFHELCDKPLAASDYIALVKRYRTIFVDNVPVMGDDNRNQTKRFILFIDTLYDHKARLFMSAEQPPQKLYQGRNQTTETFEFERTASRLFEMQSEEYLQLWADGDPRNAKTSI